MNGKLIRQFCAVLVLGTLSVSQAQTERKPLLLPEMSWVDVRDYLKASDMVIIPLGSTEQHGPHMPLGTDTYEALETSKRISQETGVMVAPVLWVGYSVYHSGFPGTLSLKPETMEEVLFESAGMLIRYGFRRIMFFNYHGGNNIVQTSVIHRINHNTEAIAVAIGHGSPIQAAGGGEDDMDWHAGKSETSIMLYLKPDFVRMDRAEKPEMTLPPRVQQIRELARKDPELAGLVGAILGTPTETGKGGASHEISSNGVWSFNHPNEATCELGEKTVKAMVDPAVRFIEAWKRVSSK